MDRVAAFAEDSSRSTGSGRFSITLPSRSASEQQPPTPGRMLSRDGSVSRSLRNLSRQQSNVGSMPEDSMGSTGMLPFEAVIHFTNSDAVLNLISPWKVQSPSTSTGTGFCIGDKRILTNCHVVQAATSLRVFKHGVPGNYEARVLCESAVCDLALVTVEDDSFWEGLPSVQFQDAVPELDDTVCAVGYPLGATSVTLTRGVVSNVQMTDLSLTNRQEKQLTVQIDAAINPGNSGGPVFNQQTNQVVGVAFSGRKDAEGMGFIIPTPVVRNFIAVYEATGSFGRLPNLGIDVQLVTNTAMRALLFGADVKHHDGVLVTRVARFSCAEAAGVLPGDIVMKIDGAPISEEGETTFRNHERVDYQFLVTSKKIGDVVTLSVLRSKTSSDAAAAGAAAGGSSSSKTVHVFDMNAAAEAPSTPSPLDLSVTLAPLHELVPREIHKDYFPEFCVVGGLVFVIAGLPMANQCLDEKRFDVFQTLLDLLDSPPRKTPADELPDKQTEAIICSDFLAHDVNEGFHDFVGSRLQKLNGVRVRNMAHFVELLRPTLDGVGALPRSHVVLQFCNTEQSAVFEAQALRKATPTIQAQHKLPNWTSLHLPGSAAPAAAPPSVEMQVSP